MPFAVWCTTCKPHETIIGQGVRFNAEKKKVGNYYSTPIYSFRMKHTACGGWIEIRTDPQNTAYVVTEGGRKRDTGEEKDLGLGEIAIKLRGQAAGEESGNDPLARLEGKVEDKKRAETEQSRIFELQRRQNRDWEDPYEQSRRLRRGFRAERKVLENAEIKREALKDKMSLGIDLMDETEEDRLRAGLIDFGPAGDAATRARPMFGSPVKTTSKGSPLASGSKHGKRSKGPDQKALLRSELTSNTRAVVDPFLSQDANTWQPESKRRKTAQNKLNETTKDADGRKPDQLPSGTSEVHLHDANTSDQKQPGTAAALVAYASDSD